MAYCILEEVEKAQGLLTVNQVAKLFGIAPQKIYDKVSNKEILSLRFAGSIKFDPKSLGYWLRKQDPTLAAAARS